MAPYRTPDWFSWDESADRYPNTRIHQARAAIFAPELGDVVPFNLSVGIFSHTISSHACVYIYIYNLVLCIYHIYIYISISHWICWQETAMILPIRFFTPRPQKKIAQSPCTCLSSLNSNFLQIVFSWYHLLRIFFLAEHNGDRMGISWDIPSCYLT